MSQTSLDRVKTSSASYGVFIDYIVYPFLPDVPFQHPVMAKMCLALNALKPITARCWFSILPEDIRKPKGFLMFSGGIEKQCRAVMG